MKAKDSTVRAMVFSPYLFPEAPVELSEFLKSVVPLGHFVRDFCSGLLNQMFRR
ncbi:hypothetical protein GW915_12625 [bacterium]|nr:hypothetical protein [bacterium]